MKTLSLSFCAGLALLTRPAVAQERPVPPPLTLEWIFRDASWIGVPPREVRWSADSRRILFRGSADGQSGAQLQALELDGSIHRLSAEEAALLEPEGASWDPARKKRVYELGGDIFLVETGPDGTQGMARRIIDTRATESRPRFALEGHLVTFEREGNLFAWGVEDGSVSQITDFRGEDPPRPAVPAPSPDGGAPDFYRSQQAELFDVVRGRARRDRERAGAESAVAAARARPGPHWVGRGRPEGASLSPEGRYVVFRLRQGAPEGKPPRVAVLITETGEPAELPGGTRAIADEDTFRLGVIDLRAAPGTEAVRWVDPASIPGARDDPLAEARKENGLPAEPRRERAFVLHLMDWQPGGKRALVQCYALDAKDRWILLLDPERASVQLLHREHDPAWIGGPAGGGAGGPGPAGWLGPGKVWIVSEAETGYAHLQALDVETGERTALTSGKFEVQDPFLSVDRRWFYFHSGEGDPAERHLYRLPSGGGQRERLTDLPGWNEARLSPDERSLCLLNSRVNQPPEIYLKTADPRSVSRAMTRCASEEFRSYPWIVPERVEVPAGDGARIPGRIFAPSGVAGGPGTGGPAVIFVHGAGYLQEIRDAWPFYFREYFFHNLLASRGYTVLEIDYRGSAGYGRDWRTAIFRRMGGRDLEDHLDAARWLASERGIDPKRIGIYGGSYGGFLVLMALFRSPETFACGAALRPVADWSYYQHGYVARILHTPDVDPGAYRQSSPIHFAEGLRRPLLICHGMADTNVRFQDTARLAQRLIELRKESWEVAIYPAEGHAFEEPASWLDEYRRILRLFETHLGRPPRRGKF